MSQVDGEKLLLLQAALDGELDAAGVLAFERALAQDEELAAEYGRQKALREVLRTLPKAVVSGALRGQIEALAPRKRKSFQWPAWLTGLGSVGSSPRPSASGAAALTWPTGWASSWTSSWTSWAPTAFAACFAFLVGSGLTFLLVPQPPAPEAQALLADHVRGLISGQPVDVVSSERHTVKPWFDTHIALSPEVVDLKSDGFPLIGGRIDVIGVTPVPTLVYRRNQHVISLSELPEELARVPEGQSSLNGFAILSWKQGSMRYIAISDAMPRELEALKTAFQKATAAKP